MDPTAEEQFAAVFNRATRYPFEQPSASYVFSDDAEYEVLDRGPWYAELSVAGGGGATTYSALAADLGAPNDDRTPVLGYGSNPAPETLRRKFANLPGRCIPVIRLRMVGFDVVYSAHMFGGFVPATLCPSPSTALDAFLLYLTDEELDLMNASESLGENYMLGRLDNVHATFESGEIATSVLTYVSLHGILTEDSLPIPVEGVVAAHRIGQPRRELHVLHDAHELIAPTVPFDEFVVASAMSNDVSREYTAALRTLSQEPDWVDLTRVAP